MSTTGGAVWGSPALRQGPAPADQSAVVVTAERYLTPAGDEIDGVGLRPAVAVEDRWLDLATGLPPTPAGNSGLFSRDLWKRAGGFVVANEAWPHMASRCASPSVSLRSWSVFLEECETAGLLRCCFFIIPHRPEGRCPPPQKWKTINEVMIMMCINNDNQE